MVEGHIDALVDEEGGDDVAKGVLGVGPRAAPEGPLGRLGKLVCELVGLRCLGEGAVLHRVEEGRVAEVPQLLPDGGVGAELVEGLEEALPGPVLIPGHASMEMSVRERPMSLVREV